MPLQKPIFLYAMAIMYMGLGIVHLVKPSLYLAVMPAWLPFKIFLIYASGVAEIVLGALLMPASTRILSARLIMAMLVVFFFVIHVPQAIDYYQTGNKYFMITLIRLPIQFLLIAWAWVYSRPSIHPYETIKSSG